MSGGDSLISVAENNPVVITQYSIGYVEVMMTNRTNDTIVAVPMAGRIQYTDTTGARRMFEMEHVFRKGSLIGPLVPPHESRLGIRQVTDEELEEFKDPVARYAILPVGVYDIEVEFHFEVFSNYEFHPLNSSMLQRFTLHVLPVDEAVHEEIRHIRNTIFENKKNGLLEVFAKMKETVSDPCYEYFLHALSVNNFLFSHREEYYFKLMWDIRFTAVERIPDTCYGLESLGQLRLRELRLREMGRGDPKYEALLERIESDSGDGLFQRVVRPIGSRWLRPE
jgi:hypothetical protein